MEQKDRVRLSSEIRKRLIRAYVKNSLTKKEKLPTRREIEMAIGGDVYTILEVLREFRECRS